MRRRLPTQDRDLLIDAHTADLLLKANQIKSLEKPSPRDYRSVLRYMENGGGQLFQEETSWVYEKEDLVTLRPGREHAWLDGILERVLKVCRCGLIRVRTPLDNQSAKGLLQRLTNESPVHLLHPSTHLPLTNNLNYY